MNNKIYIYIPILLALSFELFFPYFNNFCINGVFLSPPYYFHCLMFVAKYILLGFVLYESREINNDDIYFSAWILVFLNLLWGYYINRNNKYAIIILFMSILFGYIVYNEIFLSSLTNNGRTLYLNLMSTYIVWMGFIIALLFQYEQGKMLKKNNKIFTK